MLYKKQISTKSSAMAVFGRKNILMVRNGYTRRQTAQNGCSAFTRIFGAP
jgi:hypothetical protein